LSSAFLVSPLNARYRKENIILATLVVMGLAEAGLIFNSSPLLAYVLIVPLIVPFAVNYATMLTLFSSSVDAKEQGWVMGVSVALFTLASGSISLVGGELMSVDVHLPFVVAIAGSCIAFALIAILWRDDMMAWLDPR
jgi:DHA1 family tetracycline resistance protein-like MFS transporter